MSEPVEADGVGAPPPPPPPPSGGGRDHDPVASVAGEASAAPLADEWTIWFDKSNRKAQRSKTKGGRNIYEDCIVELGSFNTVQGFWAYWESLHVHNLKDHCNLRVFKKGIKPLWEDPHNRDGGKWVVRGVPKTNRKALWTEMVTALVSGRLRDDTTQTVCGVVLSTRDTGDSMQLWVAQAGAGAGDIGATLQALLFPQPSDAASSFIFQTHHELQQPKREHVAPDAGVEAVPDPPLQPQQPVQQPSPPPPPRDTFQEVCGSPPSDPGPLSPTAYHGQQVQPGPHMHQQQPPADQMQAMGMMPGMMMQAGMMMPMGQMPGAMGVPGMVMPMPGAGPGYGQMMGMGMGSPGVMQSPMSTPPQPPAGGRGGAKGKPARGKGAQPQFQPPMQSAGWGDVGDDDEDDDASAMFGTDGEPVSKEVRDIQERAKQIRTIRKKIRYVNFFLARQGKGRELTQPEQARIKALPFLQRELQLLEERQANDVEEQKNVLGVDNLEFLRKPQQPMTYATESERRFKTMRAIRKKIRFIHYHLERQRQGKILSAAEVAKVNALPEFEHRLAMLEAEEAAAGDGSYAGQMGDTPDSGNPMTDPGLPSPLSPAAVGDPPRSPAWPSAPGSDPSPAPSPPSLPAAGQGGAVSVQELQAQIQAQRRELEEKQRHIENLMRQGGPPPHGHPQHAQSPHRGNPQSAVSPGRNPASPGPPPLGSPQLGPSGFPVSPMRGFGGQAQGAHNHAAGTQMVGT